MHLEIQLSNVPVINIHVKLHHKLNRCKILTDLFQPLLAQQGKCSEEMEQH